MDNDAPAPRNPRRDPGRRDRIIDAALDVIADDGVEGTSLRKIAARAGVPLGSLTYYFDGREDLIAEAFIRFTDLSAAEFRAAFATADDLASARAAVVAALTSESTVDERGVSLSIEIYALALRAPRHRAIFLRWVRRCREAMSRHFDWPTTLVLDSLYEGLLIHRHLQNHAHDEALIRLAVERITPPESYHGTGEPSGPPPEERFL